MAYEYFRLQAAKLLEELLEKDIYKEYIDMANIDKEDICIEELYNIVGNKFHPFIDDIVRPVLGVYGINIIIDRDKYYVGMYDSAKNE